MVRPGVSSITVALMLTRVRLLNVGVLAMSVSMPFDCCLQSNVSFCGDGIKEVLVLTWISS